MSQWYEFFYSVASICPIGQIIIHIILIATYVPKQNDALDYIGNDYKIQTIKENMQGQTYDLYQIIKQNATITNIDSSSCHFYSQLNDANSDLNFVNTFLSQSLQSYHSKSQNIFSDLSIFFYFITAVQILFLLIICVFYFKKNQQEDIKQLRTFFENSSSIVNYYLGTILIPIIGIDYNSDCLQNYFTFWGVDPFLPYYFSIVMIILLIILLAIFSYYQVSVPWFIVATLPILVKQCKKKKKDDDGWCYCLVIVSIVLIFLVFYPTIYSIKNNQLSITVPSVISLIVSILSGIKDYIGQSERIPTSENE
ncbi:hypothetical protein ABPG74_009447 [Tetrahymena malaccensis]